MQDQVNATLTPLKRLPWNKGKLTGAKPPLRPKHVWSTSRLMHRSKNSVYSITSSARASSVALRVFGSSEFSHSLGQHRKWPRSFDNLVGTGKQRRRDREAEGLRGL